MIADVAHSVHARESLAMSCVNATVTQHNSAGDSFFLCSPCFQSFFSSRLLQWLPLFWLHTVQLSYILYSRANIQIKGLLRCQFGLKIASRSSDKKRIVAPRIFIWNSEGGVQGWWFFTL